MEKRTRKNGGGGGGAADIYMSKHAPENMYNPNTSTTKQHQEKLSGKLKKAVSGTRKCIQ